MNISRADESGCPAILAIRRISQIMQPVNFYSVRKGIIFMDQNVTIDDVMLWDEILKAIVDVMPGQLFPLLKEVLGREYPKGTSIRLLSTEHSTYAEAPEQPPNSRLADIVLVVNGTDYYHLECQMRNDGSMVIRMVAYDLHVAMQHGTTQDGETGEITMKFPNSIVIYPEKNASIPDFLRCRLIFHDGSEHIYQIPTVRIQSYSLEEILEKHLDLFIPYMILRLRPRLKSIHPLTLKELTDFVEEVIVVLHREYADGYLTEQQFHDYVYLFRDAAQRMFAQRKDLWKEVERMTKPLIELPSVREGRLRTMLAEKESELAEKDKENSDLKLEIESLKAEIDKLKKR